MFGRQEEVGSACLSLSASFSARLAAPRHQEAWSRWMDACTEWKNLQQQRKRRNGRPAPSGSWSGSNSQVEGDGHSPNVHHQQQRHTYSMRRAVMQLALGSFFAPRGRDIISARSRTGRLRRGKHEATPATGNHMSWGTRGMVSLGTRRLDPFMRRNVLERPLTGTISLSCVLSIPKCR